MKKILKGASLSLCAMLLMAGCSCKKDEKPDTKANIKNGEDKILSGLKEDVKSITLQEIYDDLKASNGNTVAADKLLEMVSNLVLSDATWQARYNAKVNEKMMDLVEDSAYQVDGTFDEELLVKTLKSKLYNITCEGGNYGPTYSNGEIDKYMVCDYSDYKEKALKISALTELLNEKYVYDKVMADKANILTTKKARQVEFVSIGYSGDSKEDEVIEYITKSITDLAAENSDVTLEKIASLWTDKQIDSLEKEYKKINTSEDANGSILSDYTNGYTQSAEKGLALKKQEVYKNSNYEKVVITSDSNSILNATLVERLLSENVISNTSRKTIKINGSYYLVAPWAGTNLTATDIRIKDSANSKYYIVKVDVINSESSADLVYEAVKILATNTTLVSDSINYYLEQQKDNINVYDEEIYTYLKTQYSNIFVD